MKENSAKRGEKIEQQLHYLRIAAAIVRAFSLKSKKFFLWCLSHRVAPVGKRPSPQLHGGSHGAPQSLFGLGGSHGNFE
jgi:hypothetical protein